MSTVQELQELQDLIESIRKVGAASRQKRQKLFTDFKIAKIQWELKDANAVLNYVKEAADQTGLDTTAKNQIVKDVENLLALSPDPPTVNWLEDELLALQNQINITILNKIKTDIDNYKPKIDSASQELQKAIGKLDDLNEAFGAIAIAVNLFAAMVSVASGQFDPLVQVVGKLLK